MIKLKDLPRQLWIRENLWTIKFVRKLEDTEKTITYGLCDPADHTIYIRLGQCPKERFKSLLHEILHALEYEYGFDMDHSLIYRLEEPMARVIFDNLFAS